MKSKTYVVAPHFEALNVENLNMVKIIVAGFKTKNYSRFRVKKLILALSCFFEKGKYLENKAYGRGQEYDFWNLHT